MNALSDVQINEMDMKLSEDYVRIVLGMDELYRNTKKAAEDKSLDNEGIVPVNLTNLTPNDYTNWDDVLSALDELRKKYVTLPNEIRRNYMQQQIHSLISIAKWSKGEDMSFREKVRDTLFVNENPLTFTERAELHRQLDELLTKKGLEGSLEAKLSKWETDLKVYPNEIESVLKELLDVAKKRVVDRMFPEMEDVEVTPKVVYGVPYSAYCDYKNQMMYINGDIHYTYPALKHLVSHESFPGHTTHLRMRELLTKAGDMPLDGALVITNTASSSIFEGIGDNGIYFIDWVDSIDDQIYQVYQTIKSTSGINAAHMIHAEQKSEAEVREFLRNYAFGEENWIASRMRFFHHSFRQPFIYSYFRGYESVNDVYRRVPKEREKDFIQFLYKNMLSADTVKHFR